MIERELRALEIAFPPEPELAPAVLDRLERRRRPVWLAPALAALAATAALLAIPQTRAAILDLFRIGGVSVERVATQPDAPDEPARLGRLVSLDEARAHAGFPLLLPAEGADVYLDDPFVNVAWDGVVLTQWRGEQLPFVMKQLGPESTMQEVLVRGAPGVWITGARHEVIYRVDGEVEFRQRRLAADVLIWEDAQATYRLEGAGTLERALALARSVRGE